MALKYFLLGVSGFSLGCALCAQATRPDEAPIPLLVIKSMSQAEIASAVPVRVRGVVTQYEAESFVIHDGNEGIFISCQIGAVPPLGHEVEVEGTTETGGYAPVIRADRITNLGERRVAPRVIAHLGELENGSMDCQWVEVEGWLRNAQPPSGAVTGYSAYATLASDQARVNITFLSTSYAEVQKWVGSRVRLQASCGHYFNQQGQLYGARLIVPRTADVVVLVPALPRVAIPLVRIDSLLRYSPSEPLQGRVHIQGVVTYQRDGTELYLQQDGRGVYVRHSDGRKLEVGDFVDVVGYLRRGAYSPEIEDANTELIDRRAEVVARPLSVTEAKISDGQLVRLTGVLLDYFPGGESTTLTFLANDGPFTASLPLPPGARKPPRAGSLVEVTGVVRALQAPGVDTPFPWTPASFELRLRTADDLHVLQRPAISPVAWGFGVVAVLTSLALLVAGTLWWQSRARVREQTKQRLIRETEFAAMIRERMRLAREIHDSLAQGFTAVSMQLEIAKYKLPGEATGAHEHLEVARTLVRESLAEARLSIQGLRLETLSTADFLAALTRSSARIFKDTDIAFHPKFEGNLAQLGADAQNELLRIATEAMTNIVKYAQAKNVQLSCRVNADYGELRVSDDGVGFATDVNRASGYGLRGMQERAHRLNGHLVVTSEPGLGTHIIARIPLTGILCNPPSSYSS